MAWDPSLRNIIDRSFLGDVPIAIVTELVSNTPLREIPAGRTFILEDGPLAAG